MAKKYKNKRMLLTLTPELHKTLFRFSKVIDRPASRIVVDFLEEIAPNIDICSDACEQAKENNFNKVSDFLDGLGKRAKSQMSISDVITDNEDYEES